MSVKESYAGKINRKLNKKLHVIDVAAGRPGGSGAEKRHFTSTYSPMSCVTGTSPPWQRASQ